MKNTRQEKILELIEKYEIDTQENLIARLKEVGFQVTQTTVSRDIRQLKLVKVLSGGAYKYVAPKNEIENSGRYSQALFASIIDIQYALNNVVIKTNPGLAQAVAAGIDALHDPEVLGSVAGDDCIILVVKSEEASVKIIEKIRLIANK